MTKDNVVRLVTQEERAKLREQAIKLISEQGLDPTEDRVESLLEKLISLKREGYVVSEDVGNDRNREGAEPYYAYNSETKEWELRPGQPMNQESVFPKK